MLTRQYYIQVIERAVVLLRQGHPDDALNVLKNALDQKVVESAVFGRGDEDTDVELVFDPRSSDTPRCWVEENHLYIDDNNWEIDRSFLEFLFQSIKYSAAQGEDVEKIRKDATEILANGVKTGRVKRRGGS